MLTNVTIFGGLMAKQIDALERSANRITIAKNTAVFNKGDPSNQLYILLRGSANAIRHDDSGRQVILNRFHPYDCFGEMGFLDGSPRCATVVTRETCDLLAIPRSAFLAVATKDTIVYENIVHLLIDKLRSATQRIEDLAISNVYSRLCRILSEHRGPGGILSESFTHQELADMVGASRETVCRLINDLTARGYLTRTSTHMVVKRDLPFS
jgi:CRP/FNR family cyclic AMP-dependent transcriptional regulator